MKIVFLGLSLTSSWGNGHATTFRALIQALAARGHEVLFLERDKPWYAAHRDLPAPSYCRVALYAELSDLAAYAEEVRTADCVVVGSYVPDGVAVCEWALDTAAGVTAFYDIDTPVTLAKLAVGDYEYLAPHVIPRFDLYLSFTGGPTLELLEQKYGAAAARAFYCAVDPAGYFPEAQPMQWDLGYLGTYSDDRQPTLTELLLRPAAALPERRFTVAGPMYPEGIVWPANVARIQHLPPAEHRAFYNAQRLTLNVTRADMIRAGWSPSVRLFEAAACGVPIISDAWAGLEELFTPSQEIIIARQAAEVEQVLRELPEAERLAMGRRARARVLAEHTATHRAAELEAHVTGASAVAPSLPLPSLSTPLPLSFA